MSKTVHRRRQLVTEWWSQEMYALVFIFRYLDLLWSYISVAWQLFGGGNCEWSLVPLSLETKEQLPGRWNPLSCQNSRIVAVYCSLRCGVGAISKIFFKASWFSSFGILFQVFMRSYDRIFRLSILIRVYEKNHGASSKFSLCVHRHKLILIWNDFLASLS